VCSSDLTRIIYIYGLRNVLQSQSSTKKIRIFIGVQVQYLPIKRFARASILYTFRVKKKIIYNGKVRLENRAIKILRNSKGLEQQQSSLTQFFALCRTLSTLQLYGVELI